MLKEFLCSYSQTLLSKRNYSRLHLQCFPSHIVLTRLLCCFHILQNIQKGFLCKTSRFRFGKLNYSRLLTLHLNFLNHKVLQNPKYHFHSLKCKLKERPGYKNTLSQQHKLSIRLQTRHFRRRKLLGGLSGFRSHRLLNRQKEFLNSYSQIRVGKKSYIRPHLLYFPSRIVQTQ